MEPGLDASGGRDGIVATTGAAVMSGGLWSVTTIVLPQLYTVVLSVVAARALGADDLGRQSFIAFVEIAATMLLTGGLPFALMRFTGTSIGGARPQHIRRLLRWAWRIEAGAAVAAASILIAVGATRSTLQGAWVLAGLAASFAILQTVPAAVLTGMQRWRDASVVGLVTGALGLVATIVVLRADGGIVGMFAVEAAAAAINLAWTTRLALRAVPPSAEADAHERAATAALLRQTRRYAAIETAQVVLFFVAQRRSELFFLERYSPAREIALYSIAFSAMTALVRVPQAFAGALAPAVATLHGAGERSRIASGFGRAMRLIVVMTLLLVAVAFAVGPAGLRVAYGSGFDEAGRILVVLLTVVPLMPLAAVCFTVVSALGHQKVPLVIGAVASLVNIAGDLLLVPHHHAIGAAIANAIAQVALGIPMVVYGVRVIGHIHWHATTLVRAAVVATVVAGGGRAVTALVDGVPGVLGGLLACGVLLAVLGPLVPFVPAEDARWLHDTAGERVRGLIGVACRAVASPRGGVDQASSG